MLQTNIRTWREELVDSPSAHNPNVPVIYKIIQIWWFVKLANIRSAGSIQCPDNSKLISIWGTLPASKNVCVQQNWSGASKTTYRSLAWTRSQPNLVKAEWPLQVIATESGSQTYRASQSPPLLLSAFRVTPLVTLLRQLSKLDQYRKRTLTNQPCQSSNFYSTKTILNRNIAEYPW